MEKRPGIRGFELEGYRAFPGQEHLDLGRITLILGRNNAGKSALCFAPVYFAQAFRSNAPMPLEQKVGDLDFGPVRSAVYRRRPTGMRFALDLEDCEVEQAGLGWTATSEGEPLRQIVTGLVLAPGTDRVVAPRTPWEEVRGEIARHPALGALPREVLALKGVRPEPERLETPVGYEPEHVEAWGREAGQILWARGEAGVQEVNTWFERLGVRIGVSPVRDHFEITAAGRAGEPVSLVDSGAGLAQALPLVVQILLARRMPRLWCLEQPELHLHPRAHVDIAELLIECIRRHPQTRLLVETHSDVLALRLRREVAAGNLGPDDVRIYFVDDQGEEGSTVRGIRLDQDANPSWWPDGVFAEPQWEFAAIRRAARDRRARDSH